MSNLSGGQWTATPANQTFAQVLGDPVLQPSPADTGSGYVTSGQGGSSAAVGVAAPTLAPGENITGATGWLYLDTGATRGATIWIFSGSTLLGTATVPTGQAPGWYSVASQPAPTAAQAGALGIAVQPNGTDTTAVHVYAAYVALATDAPDAVVVDTGTPTGGSTTSGSGTSTTGTGGTSTTGGTTSGDSTAGTGGDASTPPSPFTATLGPGPALIARPSGIVPVRVSCPETQLGGCRGTVALEVLLKKGQRLKTAPVAARRRKVTRRITKRYKVAAGKTGAVAVRLDRRTSRFVRRVRRARARVTITTDLGGGEVAKSVSTIELRARRTPRRR